MQAGARMGRYEVVRELGAGGAGVVFEAIDPELRRRVALKVLLTPDQPGAERRFELEAQALSAVAHPNVVRLHEQFRAGDRLCVAMELITGGSLQDRLQREGPLPVREAVTLLRDVARALAHVHERGVLHRDLKPANVLVDDHGRPRVSDFGLALASNRERLTSTGELLGTPAFMAPEQVSGKRGTVGVAADVYGLGATLFALLTGGPPFGGQTLVNVLSAVFTTAASPPSARRPEVDAVLDAICLRCLEKEPAARFPSAAALADALDGYLARAPGPPARRRRRARLLVAGAVGVVALAGVTAAFVTGRGEGESTPAPASTAATTSGDADATRPESLPPPTATAPPTTTARTWRKRGGMLTARFGLEGGMPWDERRGALLVYGGITRAEEDHHEVLNDFWAWDGVEWALLGVFFAPGKRYSHAIAVDPGRGRAVVFGGMGPRRESSVGRKLLPAHVWVWDGNAWAQRRVTTPASPGARHWTAAAACPPRGSVLFFGGRGPGDVDRPDLWEWDGRDATWTCHVLQPAPGARNRAAMVWDAQREVLVLFGGSVADAVVGDTWEWDGAVWRERQVAGPPARSGHGMIHDGARAVLFGGLGAGGEVLDDTWTWDGTRWEPLDLQPRPPPRERHGMGWDPRRRVVVVVGGRGGPGDEVGLSDLWELGS